MALRVQGEPHHGSIDVVANRSLVSQKGDRAIGRVTGRWRSVTILDDGTVRPQQTAPIHQSSFYVTQKIGENGPTVFAASWTSPDGTSFRGTFIPSKEGDLVPDNAHSRELFSKNAVAIQLG